MHLQILLVGSLLSYVCSRYVPSQSQLASYMRRRRDALSFGLHGQNEFDLAHRRYLYNLDSDNDADSDAYVSAETEVPISRKKSVSYSPAPYQMTESPNPYESIYTTPSYKSVASKVAQSSISQSSIKRSMFDQNDYNKQKNKKTMMAPMEATVIQRRYSQAAPYEEEEQHYAHPKYDFKYTVHDVEHHDIKHHQEERDGDNTVGEYSVLQPDGTILTVKYTVHGDEGFNAIVTKSEHPEYAKEFEHHKEYEHPKIYEHPKVYDHPKVYEHNYEQ